MVLKIIKTNKLDVGADIRKCLKEIGYAPKKSKVFIKPNIVHAFKPDSPYITNPRIVEGVIDYLQELGIKDIVVGEGPVGLDFDRVMNVSGYAKMCKEKNVKLLDLYKVPRRKHKFFDSSILLPEFVDEYEYINVAKLKTHTQTTISLCIKNQKGLLCYDDRRNFHKRGRLHEEVAELYRAVKPDFNIIDGLNGLEGSGPGTLGKEVKDLNLIVLGDDSWEVDAVVASIMGIDPSSIKHLAFVSQEFSRLQKYFEEIARYKRNFKLPSECFRVLKLTYEWTDNTCSHCSSKMGALKDEAFRSPVLLLKLLYYIFFRKLYILTGNPSDKERKGRMICIGDCSEEFALRLKCEFVKGCPPKTEDVIRAI